MYVGGRALGDYHWHVCTTVPSSWIQVCPPEPTLAFLPLLQSHGAVKANWKEISLHGERERARGGKCRLAQRRQCGQVLTLLGVLEYE